VLHSEPNPIYHRDIRWPNILRSSADTSKWLLIDWEDSSIAPTRAAPHLNSLSHHPKVFSDGHGAEVDLWSVGKLLSSQEHRYRRGDARPIMDISADLVTGRIQSADSIERLFISLGA
ncbi:15467_t:CDS:2, partial [Acaulospora colombiana]